MNAPNVVVGIKGFVKLRLSERFWNKVAVGERTECWLWLGTTKGKERPYGMIWVDGKHRPATQVAWELENAKPFPDGMMACHTCDNPSCVNPSHIWPGAMSENIKDAVSKGRHKSVGRSALTHCKHGHPFSSENTIVKPNGHRGCRQCRDMRNASRYGS